MYLSKPTECVTPRVNHDANYRLWVVMICQRRLTHCNKCITLVGDVDNGAGYVGVGARGLWEISVTLL